MNTVRFVPLLLATETYISALTLRLTLSSLTHRLFRSGGTIKLTLPAPLQRLQNLTQVCLHKVINSCLIRCKALTWPGERKGKRATQPHGWSHVVWPGMCILHKRSQGDSYTIASPSESAPDCPLTSREWWSDKEATISPGSNSQRLLLYTCVWFVVWLFPVLAKKLFEQKAAFIFILSNTA